VTSGVLEIDAAIAFDPHFSFFDAIGAHLGILVRGALLPPQCQLWSTNITNAREHWTPNFGGVQFTLGRAWYTHLEEDLGELYFQRAVESDALVERTLPGMQQAMRDLGQRVLRFAVQPRPLWCGPGVHVFPAGGLVAKRGGEPHFDTEGLENEHLGERRPAFTFVAMLQMPPDGGALRVWDRLFDGDLFPKPDASVAMDELRYEVGSVAIIDSYRMHQIAPFVGESDRISITMHVVLEQDGWHGWF
jgi:hypothetical protein